ncbi:MAG: outer membrane beta-barrel protein [Bdellovibrionales bacterium]|nr:outer membrane beta-barrel protein [Bdellovibrionales bacterium]
MNKFIVTSVVFASSLTVFAAPKSSTKVKAPAAEEQASIRAEAVKETESLDTKAYKKTIQASEAQQANVSTFLKLQDPAPELRNRPWLWTFAFKLQSMQPLGTGTVASYNFDLDSYGTGVMPSLEFGFLVNTVEGSKATWASGLSAHAGYMSQKTDLVAPNGYNFKDSRLTTTLVSAVWNNRIKTGFAPKVAFLFNPEIGFVNYTQTNNSSTLANFSQQNNFWGVGVGAEYSFTPKWALLAQYSYRDAEAKKAETSNLQKNNVEIGTQVTW